LCLHAIAAEPTPFWNVQDIIVIGTAPDGTPITFRCDLLAYENQSFVILSSCMWQQSSTLGCFMGEYKLHVSTFATTRVALLTGGAAR